MAARGGSGNESASSQEYFEFKCDLCNKDGNNVAAKAYCKDCGENICSTCIDTHRRFASMLSHNMTACSKAVSGRRPVTEMCEAHQGRIIDTVCRDHNEACCATCVSVSHRNCEDVVYLPDAAKGVSETNQYKKCIGQLDHVKLNAKSMKERRQQDKVCIQKEHDAHLTEVKKRCNDARQHIYALETGTESELSTTLHNQVVDLDTEIEKCSKVVTKVDELQAKLSGVSVENEAARFLLMMKANKLICSTGVASFPVDRTAQGKHAILKLGTTLQSLLDGMGCRAILHPESMATKPSDGKPTEKGSTVREFSKLPVSHIGLFDVQIHGENVPDISGVTFLDDGTVVLTDCNNKRLKVLDDTYRIIKHCDLRGEPVGVCATGPHEVCVAMKGMHHVQFVDTRPRKDTTRVIDVWRPCWDVAFRDHVYVLCGPSKLERVTSRLITKHDLEVREYNRAGEQRRTCKVVVSETQKRSADSLFRLAVSGDGARIHVVISNYGLITCNQQGDVLWKYTDPDLTYRPGICTGDRDHVYICGSSKVVQLDSKGNKVSDMLTKDDVILSPTAVCYDPTTRCLAVATVATGIIQHSIARLYVFQI